MFIPKGMTEQQVLDDIERVVREFGNNYAFGYYDLDDIRQEIRFESIKVLKKYKPIGKNGKFRPLPNFLYVHIKRRLLNLIRNKFKRMDPPCRMCHEGRYWEHEDGQICKRYQTWYKLNSMKANLTRPINLDGINEDSEQNVACKDRIDETIDVNALKDLINKNLDPQLRSDYLRMLSKEKIPNHRKVAVIEAVKEIIGEGYSEYFND